MTIKHACQKKHFKYGENMEKYEFVTTDVSNNYLCIAKNDNLMILQDILNGDKK